MSSTRDDGSKDRRDLRMFVGALVVGATVVSVVALAKGPWDTPQWAALGALAAVVQAVGVTMALAYAARQIRQVDRNDERRVTLDLLIKASEIFFGSIEPPTAGAVKLCRSTGVREVEQAAADIKRHLRAASDVYLHFRVYAIPLGLAGPCANLLREVSRTVSVVSTAHDSGEWAACAERLSVASDAISDALLELADGAALIGRPA